ncbi:glycosyltransferase [Halorutilales archaeon Cl-col2-1]
MSPRISTFTDTYLPTVNGVTYSIQLWKQRWNSSQTYPGRMTVTYPGSDDYDPDDDEIPVRSFDFPFYEGYRIGVPGPTLPSESRQADLVHVHSPFSMGIAGAGLARYSDLPLVASYHTPIPKYIEYLTSNDAVARRLQKVSQVWERRYLSQTDIVIVPSDEAGDELASKGVDDDKIRVLSNGVDTEFFRPVESNLLSEIGAEPPVAGYCGRHGYEKNLRDAVDAADRLPEIDFVLVGDGPARDSLIEYADSRDIDNVYFPGFLERDRLPDFYSSLDVFVFPSDVETQGIVALEATACGTPVVGADAGGLRNSIDEGRNGLRYSPGDVDAFVDRIRETFDRRDSLSENSLRMRDEIDVGSTLNDLAEIYDSLVPSQI